MKGTLPGAALPSCRRPQHCSQSRERPPPGAGLSPGLSPRDRSQGVTTAATDGNRQDDHRASPRSARPQRRSGTPKTPKSKASADQGRQRQGNDGRTRLPPRFRPFPVRTQRVPSGGTRLSPSSAEQRPGNRCRSSRRRRYHPGQRNPVAAAVRRRLQSPENARQALKTSPTSGTDSTPGASAARRRVKP